MFCLLSPGTAAAGATCPGADTSAAAASVASMRTAVACLVNQQRAAHHLPALRSVPRLTRSAQGWTDAMVRTGQFTHGADFSARISATGYFWSDAGENIATGFATPSEVVRAWMASPDHCQNILNPIYADVGTGVSSVPLGPYTPSTWTQDFGLWMDHLAPSRNSAPMRGCPYSM
jgi:uncharacterized protein YkwD